MSDFVPIWSDFPSSGRSYAVEREQTLARKNEVGEIEEREKLRLVFRQSPVAHLAVTKQVLDHMKRTPEADFQPLGKLTHPVLGHGVRDVQSSKHSERFGHLARH